MTNSEKTRRSQINILSLCQLASTFSGQKIQSSEADAKTNEQNLHRRKTLQKHLGGYERRSPTKDR